MAVHTPPIVERLKSMCNKSRLLGLGFMDHLRMVRACAGEVGDGTSVGT